MLSKSNRNNFFKEKASYPEVTSLVLWTERMEHELFHWQQININTLKHVEQNYIVCSQ